MNFISQNQIQQVLNGTVSSDSKVTSSWGALQLFGDIDNMAHHILDKTVLRYQNQYANTVDTIEVQYNNTATLRALISLSGLWSQLPFDMSSPYAYMSFDSIGDGIVQNTFTFSYDSETNTYIDLSTSGSSIISVPPEKVGYIVDTTDHNTVLGYIFYDEGVVFAGGALATHINTWNSAANSTLQFTTRLDQYDNTYSCNLNSKRTWSSSNPTFWQPIDVTDDTTTAALTAYWWEQGLTDYTISANARDFLILGDREYPLYITGIGLYDDDNDLVAVAKPRLPQKTYKNLDVNFNVKLLF